MKPLSKFSLAEWVRLEPVAQAYKQIRNDLQLGHYLGKVADEEAAFLASLGATEGRNFLLVIAFEQPLALHWLLSMAKRNVPDFQVLVFDNSLKPAARKQIAAVCAHHGAPYLALPANRTRHVNRSHGLAMTWVYEHIVRAIRPGVFGFIDHDMIPVAPVSPAANMQGQFCYGLKNAGFDCWNLWAGYCLFRYTELREPHLNFLYDFSRGLDTGGRNWHTLYRHLDEQTQRFAPEAFRDLSIPGSDMTRTAQFIDEAWVHIGGIGYNNNFDDKRQFFLDYFKGQGVVELDLPA